VRRTGLAAWDAGSAGNSNSDYNGNDPHPIPGGTSIDHFPLMQPWTATAPQKGDLNSDGYITPPMPRSRLQSQPAAVPPRVTSQRSPPPTPAVTTVLPRSTRS